MKQKIVIQSHIDNIHTVYQWLELLLKEENISQKLSQTVLLITQEITTNSILHGNKNSLNKSVTIEVDIGLKDIVIDIEDEGKGIKNLPTLKEAKELNYLEEGGRGLKLAVLMSDAVELYGNMIRLIFNR